MIGSSSGVRFRAIVFENGIADGDALVADVSAWVIRGRGDQFGDGVLRFMAERALQYFFRSGATFHFVALPQPGSAPGCNRPGSWPRLSFKRLQTAYTRHFN